MENPIYREGSAHGSLPGAWWHPRRNVSAFEDLGGTYIVTVGFVDEDFNSDFGRPFRHHHGAVVDDFGNLRVVGHEGGAA